MIHMFFGVVTLFPNMFQAVFDYGITRRAVRNKTICVKIWNPRDFVVSKYRNVDDRPYGGGPGMLLMIEPLKKAIDQAKNKLGNNSKVIYLSPQGRLLNQSFIMKFVKKNQSLILVCGRYQGIDERLISMAIDEEWSIGDYILSGGELAAMVCIDSITRMLPNVLHNQNSKGSDSFIKNRLDCPQYTRPRIFEGIQVPQVLLSGNHNNINRWRLKQSLGRTWIKKPDLLKQSPMTQEERLLLAEYKNEYLLKNKK